MGKNQKERGDQTRLKKTREGGSKEEEVLFQRRFREAKAARTDRGNTQPDKYDGEGLRFLFSAPLVSTLTFFLSFFLFLFLPSPSLFLSLLPSLYTSFHLAQSGENSVQALFSVSEVACRTATMSHRFYQKSKHIRLNSVRWTCRRTRFESLSKVSVVVYVFIGMYIVNGCEQPGSRWNFGKLASRRQVRPAFYQKFNASRSLEPFNRNYTDVQERETQATRVQTRSAVLLRLNELIKCTICTFFWKPVLKPFVHGAPRKNERTHDLGEL